VVNSIDVPLILVEGEKKSALTSQLGLASVGICGINAWHLGGSRELHPDFDPVPLRHRIVELLPDGDWRTNPDVNHAVNALAEALERRGASVRLVMLPELPEET
jgi:hypothetical protein